MIGWLGSFNLPLQSLSVMFQDTFAYNTHRMPKFVQTNIPQCRNVPPKVSHNSASGLYGILFFLIIFHFTVWPDNVLHDDLIIKDTVSSRDSRGEARPAKPG